jgi:hypothetical protein
MAFQNNKTSHTTWMSLYVQKSREPTGQLSELDDMPFNVFDEITQNLTSKPDELKLFIAGNPFNFLILPGHGKNVKIVHHLFLRAPKPDARPIVIGLHGNRKGTTVFKGIDPQAATDPMPLGAPAPRSPITRAGSKAVPTTTKMLPTIQQLIFKQTELEFAGIIGTSGLPVKNLEKWPNMFLLHPALFAELDGTKNIMATSAALAITALLRESDDEDSDKDSDDEESDSKSDKDPGERAHQTYHLLIFLWAVANGHHKSFELFDPPDTETIDEQQRSILAELEAPSYNNDDYAGPSAQINNNPALTTALIQNLNLVSEAQIASFGKADRKKSMLSRYSPEAANLFTLLSATSWTDENPQLNPFTEKLLADKDPTKALSIIHSATRQWRGRACEKGLIQFFSTGFMANDIHTKPSGFSIFMFHPDKSANGRSLKSTQQSIQAMFGDTKIDDDAVRYYSVQDFFLATSLTEFEGQLSTCIRFLELLTHPDGIASEGYHYLQSMLRDEYQTFANLFRGDPHFGIRIGYLADRVFQRFLNTLITFDGMGRPIITAAHRLQSRQREYFDDGLRGLEIGIMPNIPLPASLNPSKSRPTSAPGSSTPNPKAPATPGKTGSPHPRRPGRPPAMNRDSTLVENTNLYKEWGIPPGASHGDFFNPSKLSLKPNLTNWPEFPHHTTGTPASLCLRFQTYGKCKAACPFAHINPMTDADRTTRDALTTRFKAIYNS